MRDRKALLHKSKQSYLLTSIGSVKLSGAKDPRKVGAIREALLTPGDVLDLLLARVRLVYDMATC